MKEFILYVYTGRLSGNNVAGSIGFSLEQVRWNVRWVHRKKRTPITIVVVINRSGHRMNEL